MAVIPLVSLAQGCPVCFGMTVQFDVDRASSLTWTSRPVWAGKRIHELNSTKASIEATLKQVTHGTAPDLLHNPFAAGLSGHHSAEFLVADTQGRLLYRSTGSNLLPGLDQLPLVEKIDETTVSVWKYQGKTFRSARVELPFGIHGAPAPLTLVVATDVDFHLHFLDSFHNYLWFLTAIACLIAIATTWLSIHRGHAPIRKISQQINRINSEQLHLRLDSSSVPAELTPMATAFNQMIDRLEEGFQRLSNFSGDIAHELRTPVTNLTTQTQVVLSKARTAEEYREVLYSNLEEYERMAKMIGDMLFLAKADNGLIALDFFSINAVAELKDLADYFEAWAEERKVRIEVTGDKTLSIFADRGMLRRAFSNLLSNAIRYTPENGSIQVFICREDEFISVRITNPGPTIPPEHLAQIFERFYRPDASRHRTGEGAGLGLAIVKSIVQAHNGQVSAVSENGSTSINVRFKILNQSVACTTKAASA